MTDKFYDDADDSPDTPFGAENTNPANEVTDLGHLEGERVLPTNDMALVSLLTGIGGWIAGAVGICPLLQGFNLCFAPLAFVAWAAALAAGFIARGQIESRRDTDEAEEGDDLAVWGMAAGGAGIALGTLLLLLVAVLFIVLGVNVWRF